MVMDILVSGKITEHIKNQVQMDPDFDIDYFNKFELSRFERKIKKNIKEELFKKHDILEETKKVTKKRGDTLLSYISLIMECQKVFSRKLPIHVLKFAIKYLDNYIEIYEFMHSKYTYTTYSKLKDDNQHNKDKFISISETILNMIHNPSEHEAHVRSMNSYVCSIVEAENELDNKCLSDLFDALN